MEETTKATAKDIAIGLGSLVAISACMVIGAQIGAAAGAAGLSFIMKKTGYMD